MESYNFTEEIVDILELGQNVVERIGDCSNLERKVNIDSFFWTTASKKNGLTLQKDLFSKKARIIDSKGIQKANGSLSAMCEKMDRMTSADFLRTGDVIGVSRGTGVGLGSIVDSRKDIVGYLAE